MLKLTRLFLLVERAFLRIDDYFDRQAHAEYLAHEGVGSERIRAAIRFNAARLDGNARRLDRIELGIGE